MARPRTSTSPHLFASPKMQEPRDQKLSDGPPTAAWSSSRRPAICRPSLRGIEDSRVINGQEAKSQTTSAAITTTRPDRLVIECHRTVRQKNFKSSDLLHRPASLSLVTYVSLAVTCNVQVKTSLPVAIKERRLTRSFKKTRIKI